MNDSSVLLQPAFILQHRKYRETSLIIDVLTRDFGVQSILARGVRKRKSKTAGLLLAFKPIKISYMGKNELKLLTHVESETLFIDLKGLSLYCSFYINELISLFLYKNDPYPEVFSEYKKCLVLLSSVTEVEAILRYFELDLMGHLGYGLQLTMDVNSGIPVLLEKKYYYAGGVGMLERENGYILGETLVALEGRMALDEKALYEAKQLMRRVIDFHLDGRILKSRGILAKIIKKL